ncbi:MAG: transporter [Candidatus Omnitrophica bacterium]|nr:transporter [Candidatus Omnitrophota bacterium]
MEIVIKKWLPLIICLSFQVLFLSAAYAEFPTSSITKESAITRALNQYDESSEPERKPRVRKNEEETLAETKKNTPKDWFISPQFQYASGKFGTEQKSITIAHYLILGRTFDESDISVTLPYLWQKGSMVSTNTSRSRVGRRRVVSTTTTVTETSTQGLGDISFNGNYYLLTEDENSPMNVTLTSYVKTPTASSSKGLGSGEWDWGPGIGFAKKLIPNLQAFSDISYYFLGKAPDQETQNQVNSSSGIAYYFNERTPSQEKILKEWQADTLQRIAVSYEYNSAATKGEAESKSIALSLDFNIKDTCRLNAKGAVGLTEGSYAQDYQVGATIDF